MKVLKQITWLLLVVVLIGTNACKNDSSEQTKPVDEVLLSSETADPIPQLFIQIGVIGLETQYTEASGMGSLVKSGVNVYKITYNTTFQGEDLTASGIVAMPATAGNVITSYSIHYTKLYEEGKHSSYLFESKAFIVYSSQDPTRGQHAVTNYSTVKSNEFLSLMKVNLETGRKNQIRVHMKDLGHPIIGDKKYGSTVNPIRRLGLHAWVLAFKHPVTGKKLRFETSIPGSFLKLF